MSALAQRARRTDGQTAPLSITARDVGLRLVRPVQSRARRAPFVVVVLTVFGLGLVGLILISTTLQSMAFTQAALDREVTVLRNERDALRHDVDRLYTPSSVAAKAEQLSMVPNASPVFLRLGDNQVLGVPVRAEKVAR